jgi:hypothetical protein
MENKIQVSFECNISGINRRVDLLIDNPDGKDLMVSEIQDVIKQIKQSMKLTLPDIESVKVRYNEDPDDYDKDYISLIGKWN